MNKTIATAVIIVILVVIGSVGVKLFKPKFDEYQQKTTSDAAKTKGKIHIAMDNWVGYFPLRSSEMISLMRKSGYTLIIEDDQANYTERMRRLGKGDIEFAVATIDSYLLSSAALNFPGTIIMVIDESKGGDAILARKDRVANLDALKGRTDLVVAYTPMSPSHHLLKAAADHFNIPELISSAGNHIETDGSEAARKSLTSKKADIAVCWEPDVSRLLADKNIIKLLGTEDTQRLIVDILIVNRKYAQKEQDVVQLLISNYFKTLKKYRDNPDRLTAHVKKETKLSNKSVASMLKGVKWVNLTENCEQWFGISNSGLNADEGLVDTIDSSLDILINSGDFSDNPIPDQDPYRLTNSTFIADIYKTGVSGFTVPKSGDASQQAFNSIETRFSALTASEWDKLVEVGTLKVEPIVFQSGATELDHTAKKIVDHAVERLKHYPNFRILIKGHTSVRGDKQENIILSQGRADAVGRYLEIVYNVDANRMRALGYGGTAPLPKKSGESRRSWMYRLPRVELVLVREDY